MSDADLYAVNFGAELLACETSHILSLMMYVLNKDELNDLLSISFFALDCFSALNYSLYRGIRVNCLFSVCTFCTNGDNDNNLARLTI